eukprot:7650373-Alexandrium_andersonii.AAC.1
MTSSCSPAACSSRPRCGLGCGCASGGPGGGGRPSSWSGGPWLRCRSRLSCSRPAVFRASAAIVSCGPGPAKSDLFATTPSGLCPGPAGAKGGGSPLLSAATPV